MQESARDKIVHFTHSSVNNLVQRQELLGRPLVDELPRNDFVQHKRYIAKRNRLLVVEDATLKFSELAHDVSHI